eukprot:scaffold86218_cov66-Phaeocystis_antarctica.AAC.8
MFSPGLYRTPRCRMTCAPALANWSPNILTPRYFALDVFDTPPDPAAFLLAARVSEAKMPAGRHSSLNIYGPVGRPARQRSPVLRVYDGSDRYFPPFRWSDSTRYSSLAFLAL